MEILDYVCLKKIQIAYVEITIILDESNPNHLWNWIND